MLLTAKLKKVEHEKAGVMDSFTDHKKKLLANLLTEYQHHSGAKGTQKSRRGRLLAGVSGYSKAVGS